MATAEQKKAALERFFPNGIDGFDESKEEVAAVVAASKTATEVVDAETEEQATDLLAEAKGAVKAADKRKLAATQAHRDVQSAVNDAFKELVGPLGGIVKRLESEVLGYRRRQREKEEEAQRAAAAAERKRVEDERKRLAENARKRQEEEDAKAAAEGRKPVEQKPFEIPDPAPPPVAAAPAPKTKTTASGSRGTSVDNWKHEVVEPAHVPPAYTKTVIDDDAIKQAIKEGVREIPGVRIYNDEHLAVGC